MKAVFLSTLSRHTPRLTIIIWAHLQSFIIYDRCPRPVSSPCSIRFRSRPLIVKATRAVRGVDFYTYPLGRTVQWNNVRGLTGVVRPLSTDAPYYHREDTPVIPPVKGMKNLHTHTYTHTYTHSPVNRILFFICLIFLWFFFFLDF